MLKHVSSCNNNKFHCSANKTISKSAQNVFFKSINTMSQCQMDSTNHKKIACLAFHSKPKIIKNDFDSSDLTSFSRFSIIPATWIVFFGSMTPELGLTQYRFGAVVLILKQTFRSEGFLRVITAEAAVVKGPIKVSSC